MKPNLLELIGRAVSTHRQLRALYDPPRSIDSKYRYYPAIYDCYRRVGTDQCRWKLTIVHWELFYFSPDSGHRAGVGIASNLGLPFILGIRNNKLASINDLDLLTDKGGE